MHEWHAVKYSRVTCNRTHMMDEQISRIDTLSSVTYAEMLTHNVCHNDSKNAPNSGTLVRAWDANGHFVQGCARCGSMHLKLSSTYPGGSDTMDSMGAGDGQNFQDPKELWAKEADPDGSHSTWYKKAVDYWDGQDASYNGVLDIGKEARLRGVLLNLFGASASMQNMHAQSGVWTPLKPQPLHVAVGLCGGACPVQLPGCCCGSLVLKPQIEEAAAGSRTLVALDCGAGVGRVAKELLLHVFHEVDLLEPSQHLLEAAGSSASGIQMKATYIRPEFSRTNKVRQ
eukprot:scaffold3398_cov21-Tisochrysis_lutea.AAC.1